jgi:hypothetical protein
MFDPERRDERGEFHAVIASQLADGARPASVRTQWGEVALDYRHDENGHLYAFVPFRHWSRAWLVELDDGAYGQLHGYRYYLDGDLPEPAAGTGLMMQLTTAASRLRARGARLTAGYGGVDVLAAALVEAGLASHGYSHHDFTPVQVTEIVDVYEGRA